MEQINAFTNYLKKVFNTKNWWIILPFALIGIVFSGLFYLFSAIYMCFDLARFELRKILYNDNDKLSWSAQFVKFAISYFGYFMAAFITIIFLCILAIGFFLTFCCFFISSVGKTRGNPFIFHTITESK